MSYNAPSYSSYSAYSAPADDAAGGIDIGRIFGTLKKHFWVVILFFAAGIVGIVAYLNLATPIFQSFALLKVEQRVQDATPLTATNSVEDLRSVEMLGTIQRGFLTRSLMERVIKKLDLVERPTFFPPNTPEADRSETMAIVYLLDNIETQVVRGTRFIMLTFDHPDADLAREVTQTLIDEYISLDGEQRFSSALESVDFLTKEVDRRRARLEESKRKLSTYASDLGNVSVDSEMNIIAEKLETLNATLTKASVDRLALEADFEQIQSVRDDPKALLQIGSINLLPEIQTLRTSLNQLDGEISAASQRYGQLNPHVQELVSRRETLEERLYAEALRAPSAVEITLRAAIQNEQSLEKQVKAQEKKTLEVKQLRIESSVLQGQIDADETAFQAALQRLNQEMSQARSKPFFLQVVDPASPAYKIAPKPLIVSAIFGLGSLALAAGVIFLIAITDTSFKSIEEIESSLGLPVLAAVPRSFDQKAKGKKGGASGIAVAEDMYSTVSEAFRTLRAALLIANEEHPTVLMTSAVPSEGKSFCAINLAAAFAQQEMRTLLIDADLRKPVIEDRLFGRHDARGFSDFLAGNSELDDVVQPTEIKNLSVVSAGTVTSNPAELLARKSRVADFLSQATEKYDRVVVDSAPILAVSDTLSLARHFQTICMVVRSHKTPNRFVRRALDLLARACNATMGVALNQLPMRGGGYQYYHYQSGGYVRPGGAIPEPVPSAPSGE